VNGHLLASKLLRVIIVNTILLTWPDALINIHVVHDRWRPLAESCLCLHQFNSS